MGKVIKFCMPRESILQYKIEVENSVSVSISDTRARKLFWKWAIGYLSYVVNRIEGKMKFSEVMVVKEFIDIWSLWSSYFANFVPISKLK